MCKQLGNVVSVKLSSPVSCFNYHLKKLYFAPSARLDGIRELLYYYLFIYFIKVCVMISSGQFGFLSTELTDTYLILTDYYLLRNNGRTIFHYVYVNCCSM